VPFGGPGSRPTKFHFTTAFVTVVLLTSCGESSAPVIVSGDIEPQSLGVWVRVHGDPYIGDFAAQETNGEFELRGEVPASQTRALTLLVEQAGYAISYCGEAVKLPPLRLVGERWVNARTGEPVVIRIKLRKEINPTAPTYAERCPED
jgi:hypothetical protein